jgi:FixJ family two-component response regulator
MCSSFALTHLTESVCAPQVVICEGILPDADWKKVLGPISLLKDASGLMVLSSHANESLWSEVLKSGGDELLTKPLAEEDAVRVVGLARKTLTTSWIDNGNRLHRSRKGKTRNE